MENLLDDTVFPIIRKKELEVESFVMGCHEYKNVWAPVENEKLDIRMEPGNKKDKFAVAVIGGSEAVVGHLMKGKTGRFAKTIFYFLRESQYNRCNVRVTGKAVNQGDGKGMKIPCMLTFKGQSEFVDVLIQELKKHT